MFDRRTEEESETIYAVFKHLNLSHNDVFVPTVQKWMPSECAFRHCKVLREGNTALVDSPWGMFLVDGEGRNLHVSE